MPFIAFFTIFAPIYISSIVFYYFYMTLLSSCFTISLLHLLFTYLLPSIRHVKVS